jgi:hypothetical protein
MKTANIGYIWVIVLPKGSLEEEKYFIAPIVKISE